MACIQKSVDGFRGISPDKPGYYTRIIPLSNDGIEPKKTNDDVDDRSKYN